MHRLPRQAEFIGALRTAIRQRPAACGAVWKEAVFAAALVLVAWWSVRPGATTILPIGDFHGADPWVRGAGIVSGFAAGFAGWKAAKSRFPRVVAIAVAGATCSVCAALPIQFDQTGQLINTYARMASARAEASGAYQVPSAGGGVEDFDALRRAIPPGDTYVLYADQSYGLWVHYWLLPRVAVSSPAAADWAVFHDRDWHGAPVRVSNVRQLGKGTWIGKVAR